MIFIANIFAQIPGRREGQYGFEVYYRPPIYYDFFSELPDQNNNMRINFLLKIQNDLFRFTNNENIYTAQYEVTVAIKKEGEDIFCLPLPKSAEGIGCGAQSAITLLHYGQ